MGLTGLLLCGFLVVHLGGNLLLYAGTHVDASGALVSIYNSYAHALHSQEWFVLTAELILLVIFVAHVGVAILTTLENRAARPIQYNQKRTKKDHGVLLVSTDTWMFVSGVVVFAFLMLHLSEFRFHLVLAEQTKDMEPYDKARTVLTNAFSAIVYLIGVIILGFHLSHGFSSAFQSLGINHLKYTPVIEFLGIVFAIIVAAGFASFPIWAWSTLSVTN